MARPDMKVMLSTRWSPLGRHRHYLTSADAGARAMTGWWSDGCTLSAKDIDCWLERFDRIAAGIADRGHVGGSNAYSVGLAGDLVFVECEYDEQSKVCLTLDQMKRAFAHYRVFLSQCQGPEDQPPPAFELEYEAAGDEALERYLQNGGTQGPPPDRHQHVRADSSRRTATLTATPSAGFTPCG